MFLKVLLWSASAHSASVSAEPGDDLAALTSSLGPGDTVTLAAGTYTLESGLSWSELLGTESEPIVFEGQGEVWLERQGGGRIASLSDSTHVHFVNLGFRSVPDEQERATGLQVARSDEVRVLDCRFEDLAGTAIYFSGDTQGAVIRGNRIQNLDQQYGIYMGCSDASCWSTGALIEQNLITDIAGEGGAIGVNIENGGTDNTVRDNVLADIVGSGIRVRSTEWNDPNIVQGNAIWQTVEGIVVEGAAIVRNNVVFCVEEEGILSRASREAFEGVVISHNTIVNTGQWGIYLDNWDLGQGHVLANNAISNPTGRGIYVRTEQTVGWFGGNQVTGLVEGLERGFQAGGGYGDFLAVEQANLYPSIVSPLIGAGEDSEMAWVPSTDFSGVTRQGDAPSAGAYSWVASENPGWWIKKEFKVLGYDESVLTTEVQGCGGGRTSGLSLIGLLGLLGLGRWRRERAPRRDKGE